MRFTNLSDETLLVSFREACKLQISSDFIRMLEKEINERGLSLPNVFHKQLKKVD
ncbi:MULTISPECIES: sporulation histidine kinase inhibitor Sda [Metabacillus]|uniref:Sporulation histidine kinase inhibitor Sda n=1 Tax=Metabacillus elymi TaxID=2745198 RepID=A0ABX6S403_9BACI|nr:MULTISPECIES: sporulation histidine kinase inhibitor Sda [Metabacillus]QNF28243.1 sporulation histidine kinase inhibitor Sda [Metabacillus sp. KUDC1714]